MRTAAGAASCRMTWIHSWARAASRAVARACGVSPFQSDGCTTESKTAGAMRAKNSLDCTVRPCWRAIEASGCCGSCAISITRRRNKASPRSANASTAEVPRGCGRGKMQWRGACCAHARIHGERCDRCSADNTGHTWAAVGAGYGEGTRADAPNRPLQRCGWRRRQWAQYNVSWHVDDKRPGPPLVDVAARGIGRGWASVHRASNRLDK
jgi:hypothetical protein